VDKDVVVAVCEYVPLTNTCYAMNVEEEGENAMAIAILQALLSCPIDYRAQAAANIIIADHAPNSCKRDDLVLLAQSRAEFHRLNVVLRKAKFTEFIVDHVSWYGANVISMSLRSWPTALVSVYETLATGPIADINVAEVRKTVGEDAPTAQNIWMREMA